MSVADVMSLTATKTPIEKASAAKEAVAEFEHVMHTMTTSPGRSALERLLRPHSRRESTECAVVMAYQPITAATSSPAFQGDVKSFAYPYWLTTALTEPLATVTLASFEAPFRWSPPSSLWRDLVEHFLSHAERQPDLNLTSTHWGEVGREAVVEAEAELVVEDTESTAETPRAYRAFVELADWLEQTQAETADLLGMGRTTPLAWKRDGHEPQPARARRLYQTHALVSTLVRRLGREETRNWIESGNPSPLSLVAAGDVSGAVDLADELIFGTPASERRLTTWVDEPDDTDPVAPTPKQAQPRRVRRRPPRRRSR